MLSKSHGKKCSYAYVHNKELQIFSYMVIKYFILQEVFFFSSFKFIYQWTIVTPTPINPSKPPSTFSSQFSNIQHGVPSLESLFLFFFFFSFSLMALLFQRGKGTNQSFHLLATILPRDLSRYEVNTSRFPITFTWQNQNKNQLNILVPTLKLK